MSKMTTSSQHPEIFLFSNSSEITNNKYPSATLLIDGQSTGLPIQTVSPSTQIIPKTEQSPRIGYSKIFKDQVLTYKNTGEDFDYANYGDLKNNHHLMDVLDSMPYLVYLKILFLHQYLLFDAVLRRENVIKIPIKNGVSDNNVNIEEERLPYYLTSIEIAYYSSFLVYILSHFDMFNESIANKTELFVKYFISSVDEMLTKYFSYNPSVVVRFDVCRGYNRDKTMDFYLKSIMEKIDYYTSRELLDNLIYIIDQFVYKKYGSSNFGIKADKHLLGLKQSFQSIFDGKNCYMYYNDVTDWKINIKKRQTATVISFTKLLIDFYSNITGLGDNTIKLFLGIDDKYNVLAKIYGVTNVTSSKLVTYIDREDMDEQIDKMRYNSTISDNVLNISSINFDPEEAYKIGKSLGVLIPFVIRNEQCIFIPTEDSSINKINKNSEYLRVIDRFELLYFVTNFKLDDNIIYLFPNDGIIFKSKNNRKLDKFPGLTIQSAKGDDYTKWIDDFGESKSLYINNILDVNNLIMFNVDSTNSDVFIYNVCRKTFVWFLDMLLKDFNVQATSLSKNYVGGGLINFSTVLKLNNILKI